MFTIAFAAVASVVVVKVVVDWQKAPYLPESVAYRGRRRPLEILINALIKLGLFLERWDISSPEGVIRGMMAAGERKAIKSIEAGIFDPEVTVERVDIEQVPCYLLKPKRPLTDVGNDEQKLLPVVVYFHGGGWVFGNTTSHLPFIAWIVKATNVAAISVGFRCPPETSYEAQIEDCVKVTFKMCTDPNVYGVDGSRVFVAGDSSGGNLAASVAMQLPKQVRAVLLISAATQGGTFSTPAHKAYLHFNRNPEMFMAKRAGFAMTPGIQSIFHHALSLPEETLAQWQHDYFNVDAIEGYDYPNNTAVGKYEPPELVHLTDYDKQAMARIRKMVEDPKAYPLIAPDEMLTGMPPHFIQICEIDMARDDGYLYADRLKKLGVTVELNYLKNACHTEPITSFLLPKPIGEAARIGLEEIAKFINTYKQ